MTTSCRQFFRIATVCQLLPALLWLTAGIGEARPPLPQSPVSITRIATGVGGVTKIGYWSPVRIELQGEGASMRCRLELETLDGEGLRVVYRNRSDAAVLTVSAGEATATFRYYKPGRLEAPLTVRVLEAETDRVIAEQTVSPRHLPSTMSLYVQLGDGVGIERVIPYGSRSSAHGIATRHIAGTTSLPDHYLGYDGVDGMLLTTTDLSWLDALSDRQRTALREWVSGGGRLVISAAVSATRLFGEGGELADWSPGEVVGIRESFETTGLMNYSRAAQPLPPRFRAPFAEVKAPAGRILAYEGGGGLGDRPMMIERAIGFGQVVILLIDLEEPEFSQWLGVPRLLASMLGIVEDDPGSGQGGSHPVATVAYSDIIGQLRGALDQFSDVVLVRFSWIAALIVGYLLIIGPADYFGLKIVRKHHWTWLTFPLLVIVFSVLAVLLSRGLKGKEVRVNQVHIVDYDTVSGTVRGALWAHVYSPNLTRRDVSLKTERLIAAGVRTSESTLSWQGSPGSLIGGMVGPTGMVVQADPYGVAVGGSLGEVSGLPATVGSTKSLFGQWRGTWNNSAAESARLTTSRNGLLSGEFVNPLPVRLERVMIAYGVWLYRLPYALEPGQRVRMRELAPLDLRWQLTRRRVVKSHDVSLPWNPEDVDDLPRIVEMLMFYDAAGGRNYTRLRHEYQDDIDLSTQLNLERAILVGRAAEPLATLHFANESAQPRFDRRLQIVRIMWPVEPASEDERD